MKISSFNSNISFAKELKATCAVKKNRAQIPCRIYQLDIKEDENYFLELDKKPSWYNNEFVYVANTMFRHFPSQKAPCFVLEDEDENCLGFCVADVSKHYQNIIDYIETVPRQPKKRKTHKYAGESLIAFLCKLTQQDKEKQGIMLSGVLFDAIPFYEKCGFKHEFYEASEHLLLSSSDFEELYKQNENHTGKRIELVG